LALLLRPHLNEQGFKLLEHYQGLARRRVIRETETPLSEGDIKHYLSWLNDSVFEMLLLANASFTNHSQLVQELEQGLEVFVKWPNILSQNFNRVRKGLREKLLNDAMSKCTCSETSKINRSK
jgi:hypothetical protein